mgnify:CR=1 FL=1
MPTFKASGLYAALRATVAPVTVDHKSIDSSVERSSRFGTSRYGKTSTCPAAYGYAFKIAKEEMESDHLKIKAYHEQFLKEAMKIEHAYINGDLDNKVPNILNISFNFVEGESLIMGLKDIAVSSGSACTSASLEPSYVLRALGRKDELAHSSIRFSFGRFTSDEDIKNTLSIYSSVRV